MPVSQSTPGTHAIYAMAWPLAMNAMLLHSSLIIDTMLITPLGEEALAAMGLAVSVASLMLGVIFAFSNGTQILLAQGHGASSPVALKSAFWSGIFINAFSAAIGIVFVWTVGGWLIGKIAHTTLMAAQATDYLQIFTVVIVGKSISQGISVYFNATGRPKLPFYSNLVEMPINAGISILLIYGLWGFPEMGLAGAAVGSAIAAVVRTVFLSICMNHLSAGEIRVDGWLKSTFALTIGNHFKQAIPIAGTFISMTMAKNVCMLLYAKMSIVNFAAMTLILPWMQFLVFIMMAWAQATGIFVGQLLGKNISGKGLDEFIGRAWRVAFFLAALVSLAYFIMSLLLGWIYSDLQAETLSALWSFMPVLLIITFPKVSNSICGNVLRAGGDAVHVMKIHMVTQWFVWVPLTAVSILYLKLPVSWVFAIFLIDEIVKILPFHRRMLGGKWKRNLANLNHS